MIYFVIILVIIVFILVYNIIRKKCNKVRESFSTLDVYLKKRYDLIPNLVSCVRGYSIYEAETLEQVTRLRSYDCNILKDSIINFESYPKLKADGVFINLQKNLTDIEEQISAARRNYNACVNDYNTFISIVPINLFALLYGFKKYDLYSIGIIERENVNAKFN